MSLLCRSSIGLRVPQIQFIARVVLWRQWRGFSAFLAIFRAPPVVPELSASFRSPRWRRVLRRRGLLHNFMLRVWWHKHPLWRLASTTTATTTTLRSHFGSRRGYPQRISAAWGTVRCHLEQANKVHSEFACVLCAWFGMPFEKVPVSKFDEPEPGAVSGAVAEPQQMSEGWNFVKQLAAILGLYAARFFLLDATASPACLIAATSFGFFGRWLCPWRNAWFDSGYGACDSAWLLEEFHISSTSTWARILAFDLSPCTRCSPFEYRHCFYESMSWIPVMMWCIFSSSVRIFRTPPLVVESLVVMQINSQRLLIETFCLKARVNNNNNNNNTIWGGSVLTGEEPPPHSGELKHALSQAGGPTQSQLSRPMSSGHQPHLHGAPTTEETVKLWYWRQH